jgi:3-phosphoshikimate 1-carboxyvinyltransferase
MSLPDLIEIVPIEAPVHAQITVPGSKSITNRALVLAALAEGERTLTGALWSEDTQVMVECLQELGFMVNVAPDPDEPCNRTITVYGQGGTVPRGGTVEQPMELFVGNAGTAARFLTALLCLGEGIYRLHGIARMHERPQAALFAALRQLGYRIDSPTDKLPALIHGRGPTPDGKCTVSIEDSSQFASALLLCADTGKWKIDVMGHNAEESPYVEMTRKLVAEFPRHRTQFTIEPDASSGSYFVGAGWLLSRQASNTSGSFPTKRPLTVPEILDRLRENSVSVSHWPVSTWQIDSQFPKFLAFPSRISRETELGDSIMTAIVLAPFAGNRVEFNGLGRLRLQECERVQALQTELTACGAKVLQSGDTLQVYPSTIHGAEIETYNDHRMAMCFAILGLKVPGMKIKNPACVKKTFPNFFQKLATPPPDGLGAAILDGRSGRKLACEELFAD